MLRGERLSRHFGGVRAVVDADVVARQNEVLAIIGPNGAGKTTLFNLLTRQIGPTSGRIFYGDTEITALPPHALPGIGIARTFQRTNLFWDLSVRENVRLAVQAKRVAGYPVHRHRDTYPEVDASVNEVLHRVGLEAYADLPARQLSHGDQRLTEVAIALGSAPRVLLLDEPLAGMAPTETSRTVVLFNELRKDISIILIEHDMEVVLSLADHVIVMNFGQVIAEGSPAEVRANEQVQAAYFGGGA